jgi:phosphoglycerate dehydrogenase-like enzyme
MSGDDRCIDDGERGRNSMATTRILVLERFADAYERRIRERFSNVDVIAAQTLRDLPADLSDIDVLIAFGIAIDDDLIRRMTGLKWVQSLATGVDHFTKCPYFRTETLARGIHGPPMRETVAFLMLALSRGAARLTENKAAKRWDRGQPWTPLDARTAVIVGVGVSGIAIAKLLKAFGMRAIGVTRTPRAIEGFDEVVETARLVEAVGRADWLIGVLPGDARNADLIDGKVFAAMPRGACFINVGRGSTVDEDALIEALRSGHLGGAGLDVVRQSPLANTSLLWELPNVVLSPQIGGYTSDYERMVMPIVEQNLELFLSGRGDEMLNLVPH